MADRVNRIGFAFAKQFYESIVDDGSDAYVMLDEDTIYTTGDGNVPPLQQSIVGREMINLDLEISIFRGKLLQLASVDTQETFDEGLIVLVNGAAVDNNDAENSRSFVQTFFLGKDPSEGGFFIRNTIIRFLAKSGDTKKQSNATAEGASASGTAAKAPSAKAKSPAKVVVKEEADKRVAPVPGPKAVEVSKPASNGAIGAAPTGATATAAGAASGKSKKKKSDSNSNIASGKKEAKENSGAAEKKVEEKKAAAPSPPASFLDAAKRNGPAKKAVPMKNKEGGAKGGISGAGANNVNKGGNAKGASNNNNNNNNKAASSKTGGDSKNKNNNNKSEKKGKKEKEAKDEGKGGSHINTNAQCYVSNIAFATTNEDLTKLLSQFGKVKSVTRPQTKGYGFVEFFEDKDSMKAIVNAKNISLVLDGRELKIEERTGQSSSSSGSGASKDKEGAKKKKEVNKKK